ncbi:MAG: hypothetical protein P4N41_18045 [Negativicutes bacterium]|nr:hypothetical protein [Negativicutes bacterium]
MAKLDNIKINLEVNAGIMQLAKLGAAIKDHKGALVICSESTFDQNAEQCQKCDAFAICLYRTKELPYQPIQADTSLVMLPREEHEKLHDNKIDIRKTKEELLKSWGIRKE